MKTLNLKTGLAFMIEQVEALPADTFFNMAQYKDCVIGKTVGWGESVRKSESTILRKYFGIRKTKLGEWDKNYFSCNSAFHFTDSTWEVIRLFTSAEFPSSVSRDVWLEAAYQQFAKM